MRFGVREICDVVFKASANNQKVGNKVFKKYQPVFMIDTARTSNFEQAATTVYAQGGRGYARLLSWEGEKTMTFTVEDALMSPMGLAVLSGAGLINHAVGDSARVHCTVAKTVGADGSIDIDLDDLKEETGLDTATNFVVCNCIPMYATVVGASGADADFLEIDELTDPVTVDATHNATLTVDAVNAGKNVIVDFYLAMTNSVQTITIGPEDFGGYFYVEAQTLFRDEATGKDVAANITFPKVKIQSGFTFTMAASGDPSTFNFVMDAFPGYTIAKCNKRTMCDIQILSAQGAADDDCLDCDLKKPTEDIPGFNVPDAEIVIAGSKKVGTSTIPTEFPYATEYKANQNAVTVTVTGDTIDLGVASVAALNKWTSTDPGQATYGDVAWIAVDVCIGPTADITKLKYNGNDLTSDDVADAAAWGLGAGHFILWIKADEVLTTPKTFTLSGDNFETKTVTVTVTEG
jgi:hypothetical protein